MPKQIFQVYRDSMPLGKISTTSRRKLLRDLAVRGLLLGSSEVSLFPCTDVAGCLVSSDVGSHYTVRDGVAVDASGRRI